MRIRVGVCAILFSVPAVTGVSAGTVLLHDNGGPTNDNAWVSDPSLQQTADDFTIETPVAVTCVEWWGAYKNGDPLMEGDDRFAVRFFAIENGVPDPTPTVNLPIGSPPREDTGGRLAGGNAVFRYQAEFTPATLPAGDYLLSIVNNTLAFDSDWLWAWNDTTDRGIWNRSGGGQPWNFGDNAAQVAFRIYIPEPVTLMLLAGGSLLLMGRRSPA